MVQVEIYQMITEDTEDLDVLDCRALQCARVCHSKRESKESDQKSEESLMKQLPPFEHRSKS